MNKAIELTTATQRALELFDNAHIGADPFEKAIGVAQGTIKNLKNGKNLISADCIIKFAKYFNVSSDYLLCLTNNPTLLDENIPSSIMERPDYVVSFVEQFDSIIQEKMFVNIATLYTKIKEPQDKGTIFGFVLDLAKHNGVDTKALVGY